MAWYFQDMSIDQVDRQLLELLQHNARASLTSLAKEVNLSAPAVSERLKKLELAGIIRGFLTDIHPGKLGLPIAAFIAISVKPRKSGPPLAEALSKLPAVEELYAVAGPYSYLAKVRLPSTEDLDQFLDELLLVDGVEHTETTMILRTVAEHALIVTNALSEELQ